MIVMDGVELKVGMDVWSFARGYGVIESLGYMPYHPILIDHGDQGRGAYTKKFSLNKGAPRCLYLCKPKIEIVVPKRTRPAWRWVIQLPNGDFCVTTGHYNNQRQYEYDENRGYLLVQKIDCTEIQQEY